MPPTAPQSVPVSTDDPVNAAILSVSEDRIQGFSATPFADIARQSEVPLDTVLARITAMLEAGQGARQVAAQPMSAIAEALAISEANVRVILHRARQALRRCLEKKMGA